MTTKRQFTQYEIRQELSNYASAIFKDAKEIIMHFCANGAFVYAKFADKVKEYIYISYESICIMLEHGQHGRAMSIIGCDEDEILPDSINYNIC